MSNLKQNQDMIEKKKKKERMKWKNMNKIIGLKKVIKNIYQT